MAAGEAKLFFRISAAVAVYASVKTAGVFLQYDFRDLNTNGRSYDILVEYFGFKGFINGIRRIPQLGKLLVHLLNNEYIVKSSCPEIFHDSGSVFSEIIEVQRTPSVDQRII